MRLEGRLKELKALFPALYNAFLLQLADLGGQAASLNLQVIRQLLAVKGDIKTCALRLFGLEHQISHEFLPGGTPGSDLDLLVKHEVFGSDILHQIENHLLMEAAGIGAGVENAVTVDQHDFAGLICDDVHRNGRYLGAGKGLGEDFRGLNAGEDGSVPKVVDLHDLGGAGKNDADVSGRIALRENGLFLFIGSHSCPKAAQQDQQIFGFDLAEERAVLQNLDVLLHKILHKNA